MKFVITICCSLLFGVHFSNAGESQDEPPGTDLRTKRQLTIYPDGFKLRWQNTTLIDWKKDHIVVGNDPKAFDLPVDQPEGVQFFIYTNGNNKEYQEITQYDNAAKIANNGFNPAYETVFITHGYLNTGSSDCVTLLRDAYLKSPYVNVIVFEWSSITISTYHYASSHASAAGVEVGKMIQHLVSTMKIDPTKITLVGHSLGAHVMGFAGKYLRGRVGFIYGLDPANPNFSDVTPDKRLAKGDAIYVQVIHTSYWGIAEPIGNADFYMNGGFFQPDCAFGDLGGLCSHGQSFYYFAESLNSKVGFYGMRCSRVENFMVVGCSAKRTVLMGGRRTAMPNGIILVPTGTVAPYALGK